MKYFLLACIAFFSLSSIAAETHPEALEGVSIDSVLGTSVPLEEEFLDDKGNAVALSSFFDGKNPVVLVLSYYECPMLCGLLLNGVRDSFRGLEWLPGDHYKIVTISIDPKEGSALAASKRASILGSMPESAYRSALEKNWHFLVGKAGSEVRLADAVGFHYKWIEEEKQYAHPAAIFILSPQGKLTRVLQGLDFPARDLKLALLESGEGKFGTFAEKLLLFCYHYEPKENKYALLASRLVSLGGAITVAGFLFFYLLWFFRSRRKGNTC